MVLGIIASICASVFTDASSVDKCVHRVVECTKATPTKETLEACLFVEQWSTVEAELKKIDEAVKAQQLKPVKKP